MAIAGAGLIISQERKNAARNWEEKSEERVRRRWWRVLWMREPLPLIWSPLSHENHEVIDVGKHLMEEEILKWLFLVWIDEGKAIGRRRRKSISWVCDSMNVLFKWVVPWVQEDSEWLGAGQEGEEGVWEMTEVCCRSGTGLQHEHLPDLTFSLLPPMPPHFAGHGNLETSPNLPSNPLKQQRNGEIRHRMSPYITYADMEFQSWGVWLSWWKIK